jgi:hypothetical protein
LPGIVCAFGDQAGFQPLPGNALELAEKEELGDGDHFIPSAGRTAGSPKTEASAGITKLVKRSIAVLSNWIIWME